MTSRPFGLSPVAVAAWLIGVMTVLRFFIANWLPLVPDEAYYWQWSRHLDASYYSKGPAVAYTIWVGTKLFGDTVFGIRFFAVLLSAGTAWQVFLLARRWYDDMTGVVAVLILNVIPLYAAGAVLMTIDPLSAFFWVWAANFFSDAIRTEKLTDWASTGFALGCGFLAKYVNGLELLGFVLFLAASPRHRPSLQRAGFWGMLNVAVFCSLPVWWWNALNRWASVHQLIHRGRLDEPFTVHRDTLAGFLGFQSVMISPLLFIAFLTVAVLTARNWYLNRVRNEAEILFLCLFLSVFGFYTVIALHLRTEPNWPAVSYFGLIVVVAAVCRQSLGKPGEWRFIPVYLVGWAECIALYYMCILPVPKALDPANRTVGWREIAANLDHLRRIEHADIVIGDGYKEASIVSFYLPDHLAYAKHAAPPATQYDYWPKYPTTAPHRALWMTIDDTPVALANDFRFIRPVERFEVLDRGQVVRRYNVYLCGNR